MEIGDLATWIGSIGTVAALGVAGIVAVLELRAQRTEQRVERTLLAHKDITTGEAWEARDRLAEYMWRRGSDANGYFCWQPTYRELQGASYGQPTEAAGDLSRYPPDIQPADGQTPMRDLYLILWQFERVSVAYTAGLLDNKLAVQMLASHFVWWDIFCSRITVNDTKYRESLARLARSFREHDPALVTWAQPNFVPQE